MTNNINKILLIRLSAIGDTIHTLPFANALKENFPNATLDWIVEDKASFFVRQTKCVDNVIVLPKKKWKQEKNIFKNFADFWNIITKLKEEKYDLAIDVQQLFKSGLILGFCGAKRKLSMNIAREGANIFANEVIKAKTKLFDPDYHVTERYNEFLEYLGKKNKGKIVFNLKDFSKESIEFAKEIFLNLDNSKKTMVFAPATTWENKHWNIENWRKLFEHFKNKTNIIFTGTANDIKLVNSITDGINGEYTNLCGKTDLEQLAQILKMSDIVISPDSGTAHIAWAVEKPYIITIFTATAKGRTAPIGEICFSFAPQLPCAPCSKRKCTLKENINACSNSVCAQIIINKIEELLK